MMTCIAIALLAAAVVIIVTAVGFGSALAISRRFERRRISP
jgi:hypothetical protein